MSEPADRTWWLSYADESGPRGVCIVRSPDIVSAVFRARVLRISPGGNVKGFPAPPAFEPELTPYLNRCLTVEEARALGGAVVGPEGVPA